VKSIKRIFKGTGFSKNDQYSHLANDYGRGIRQAFVREEYKQILSEWAGFDTQPKKILDVGCGDGLYTDFLQREYSGGVPVIGIDISETMIETARKIYDDIDFRLENMNKMSLATAEVDVVFSRFSVHYSTDLQATMKEIGRVTKTGGLFFMKEVHPFYATFFKESKNYEKKEMTAFRTQGENGVAVVHPTFTLEEYSKAFSAGGWRLKGIHEYYGVDASGEKIAPMRVPTSIIFILIKE
jgi:ubiquinone/menaquinone biosynthesis C-methylase UbiE